MSKILLLSVGINKYPFLSQEYQLNYCVNDARLIHNKYSQFELLYNKLLIDEEATRINILKAIKDIVHAARDDDYVIFSFAGHGFTTSTEVDKINSMNTFLCPSDFEEKYSEETALKIGDLNELIKSINANSKLIILDACHSGGALRRTLSRSKLREIKIDKVIELIGHNKGTGTLTACDSDEFAIEDPELEHGVFTHSFVNVLENIEHEAEDYLFSFDGIYASILEKVRDKTENKQNPQSISSNDYFKILVLPKEEVRATKEIHIGKDTLVPSSAVQKPIEYYTEEELNEFESLIIELIESNKVISIDKLIKKEINKLYSKLSTPSISFQASKEEAIDYYENCREYAKPLMTLCRYIFEYSDTEYIIKNLPYIFKLQELTQYKSGKPAIVQIPTIILSEIIFDFLSFAYKDKNLDVLKAILKSSVEKYNGRLKPVIYLSEFWHPDLFNTNVSIYLNYLYPENERTEDIFSSDKLRYLNEIVFLLCCYGKSKEDLHYVSYPSYLVLDDFEVPRRIARKLEDNNFTVFIETLFDVKIDDFYQYILQLEDTLTRKWEIDLDAAESMLFLVNQVKSFGNLD
ncbi:caspase family protein [Methanolobus sp. ZRKC2]|uniref:caspase family protein n=1 Tax=Methanolobus sp. ZRKC2 TaxID=3125783 RepID=UPI00325003B0